jgi:hypothetical protein
VAMYLTMLTRCLDLLLKTMQRTITNTLRNIVIAKESTPILLFIIKSSICKLHLGLLSDLLNGAMIISSI